jgi:hypothetical protein
MPAHGDESVIVNVLNSNVSSVAVNPEIDSVG